MSHDHNAIEALFALPFNDLLFRAHTVHRAHFDPNRVQRSTLLSIKTGGCSEDCGYCSQSARFDTSIERQPLLPLDDVVAAAQAAKDRGATRFCMARKTRISTRLLRWCAPSKRWTLKPA
jgi:biotin synthase